MKNHFRTIYWFPIIGAALLCAGMWLGYLLSPRVDLDSSQRKMLEVLALINREYVDDVPLDSLISTLTRLTYRPKTWSVSTQNLRAVSVASVYSSRLRAIQ